MIILLTNKDDITVDFVVRELQEQQLPYYRLNTEDIPFLVEVDFSLDKDQLFLHDKKKNISVDLEKCTSVYFRRAEVSALEYLYDVNDCEKRYLRTELAYILEGIYKILREKYWLNNIYKIREAENKIYQLQMAKEVGFDIPPSIISNNSQSIKNALVDCADDCITKPIKSGNMKDDDNARLIFTSKLNKISSHKMSNIELFPLYMQKNIHKRFDLRCIVVGECVFCAQIDSQCNPDSVIDWRKSRKYLNHTIHQLPLEVANKCIKIAKNLGLNYSAIDLVLDKNSNYIFLECNPNGQWAWLEKRLGFPISKSIVKLLKARGRCH